MKQEKSGRSIFKICIDTQEEVVVHMCGFDGLWRGNYFRGEPIGRAEVEVRVGNLKNGKAPGKDEITGRKGIRKKKREKKRMKERDRKKRMKERKRKKENEKEREKKRIKERETEKKRMKEREKRMNERER